jgi:aminoglycoside phosphotransferase (APT) family kinase protein
VPVINDGNFENVTRLDADSVVKRYQRRERYLAERRTLTLLAGRGIAPELRYTCDTHLTLRMSRVAGRTLRRTDETSREPYPVLRGLAQTLAALHAVPPGDDAPPLDDIAVRAEWRQRLEQRIASLPIPWSDVAALRRWADRAAVMLPRVERAVLLHHDPKPDNLVWDGRRVVLLDFDQSRWGHPLSDLGKLRWRTLPPVDRADAPWRRFLSHYRAGYPGEFDPAAVELFRTGHALGSLAYWFDFQNPRYLRHAVPAAELVAEATGVQVRLNATEVPA